jgi:FkbM family methyltransferase
MSLLRRAVGSVSRATGRPELLAAVYPAARAALREEIAIRAILAASLAEDASYVDIGTNRGQVLKDAVRVAPRGRHLAFEPIPALAAEVRRTFPDVDCRQLALGARREVAQFCHFRKLDGWSGLRRSAEISDERGEPEFIDVEVSTLDSEVGELVPSVIKIDVEGAELAVLQGARTVLAEARPLIIFEHVATASALYGEEPEALWDLLAESGYTVFSVTGEGPLTRSRFAAAGETVNWLATPGQVRTAGARRAALGGDARSAATLGDASGGAATLSDR